MLSFFDIIGGNMELDWISKQQVAEKWGLTERHVQSLCKRGMIDGIARIGRSWLIPKDAKRPVDGRTIDAKRKKQQYVG